MIKKTFVYYFCILSIVINISACCSNKVTSKQSENASKLYGNKMAQRQKSPNGEYMLVFELKHSTANPEASIPFIVYEINSGKILKEGEEHGQFIKWHDDKSIEIVPYIGQIQTPDVNTPPEKENNKIIYIKD